MDRRLLVTIIFSLIVQLSAEKLTADPCSTLKDGDYAIRDVFKYMTCKSGQASYTKCPKNDIYAPSKSKCVDISTQSTQVFCYNRSNSDWANPWNCHGFVKCFYSKTYTFSCQLPNLNYNPYQDACVYKNQYPCNQIKPTAQINTAKKPCADLSDGEYAIPDVFAYMQCKNHTAKYITCANGQVYNGKQKKCVDGASLTKNNFCLNRNTGNYRNPWDCHSYISCVHNVVIERPCSLKSLVYDPYNDLCEYSSKFKCKELTTNKFKINNVPSDKNDEDPCVDLPDGNYPSRDVAVIMVCHEHHHHYVHCAQGEIYVPNKKKCIPLSAIKFASFCKKRKDGNWRNPWNCHNYITCHAEQTFDRKCSILVTLNYNPYIDQCDYPHAYKCQNITDSLVDATNPCKGKQDGNYPIPDVFKYLTCKGGKATYSACPEHKIYDPSGAECVNLNSQSLPAFCHNRADGDWANPWNCYQYIVCAKGSTRSYPCLINGFVFNPYQDVCVEYGSYPCKNGHQESSKLMHIKHTAFGNPCEKKLDGLYGIADVFSFLQCKEHNAKILHCEKETIFDEINSKCNPGLEYSKDVFCVARKTGNYRNPWNCHGFISCVHGRVIEQACALNYLVYDPYTDACELPSKFSCYQLATRPCTPVPGYSSGKNWCENAPDGQYPLQDVFQYVICKNKQSDIHLCPQNTIYSPSSKTCVTTINPANFCVDRKPCYCNWRNPWDCHHFITCNHGQYFNRPCGKDNTLVYRPNQDRCDYPSNFNCTTIKSDLVSNVAHPKIKDICTTIPDGNYATRDVLMILQCKAHVSHIVACGEGQIYIPGNVNCTEASKIKKDAFCEGRTDGNWRNPWNCHSFFTCHAGRVFERNCSLSILTYDPDRDSCVFASEFPCKNVSTEVFHERNFILPPALDDQCSHLPDGHFAVCDVFVVMACRSHHHRYISCEVGQIYDPAAERCVSGYDVTIASFCKGRKDGNWRNPWNCHNYITCHAEQTFDRKCSILATLNYNPYIDQCDYPSLYPCKQL